MLGDESIPVFPSPIQSKQIMKTTISQKQYTISQASKIMGVSRSTLRRWEKARKISSTVDENGIHLYQVDTQKYASQSPSELLSVSEAARVVGVSKATLRRWENAGLVKSERTVGDARRYKKENL